MKQVTLNVDESKYETFLSFIKTLDYVSVAQDFEIPDWQKEEVARRLKLTSTGEIKTADWPEVNSRIFG
jgi:hypothetical protein